MVSKRQHGARCEIETFAWVKLAKKPGVTLHCGYHNFHLCLRVYRHNALEMAVHGLIQDIHRSVNSKWRWIHVI